MWGFRANSGENDSPPHLQQIATLCRVTSIAPNHDLPTLSCANLETVLASFMYYVSAGHNHVGTVAAEIEDPCFMPWAWTKILSGDKYMLMVELNISCGDGDTEALVCARTGRW